jgi:zinc protease
VALLRTLLADYSQTSPQMMQLLAERYFAQAVPFKLAVLPESQQLAAGPASPAASVRIREPEMAGR